MLHLSLNPKPIKQQTVSRFTETDRNGPKQTGTDRNVPTKIPKRTARTTETGLNKGRVGGSGHDRVGRSFRRFTSKLSWSWPTYLPTNLPTHTCLFYLLNSPSLPYTTLHIVIAIYLKVRWGEVEWWGEVRWGEGGGEVRWGWGWGLGCGWGWSEVRWGDVKWGWGEMR